MVGHVVAAHCVQSALVVQGTSALCHAQVFGAGGGVGDGGVGVGAGVGDGGVGVGAGVGVGEGGAGPLCPQTGGEPAQKFAAPGEKGRREGAASTMVERGKRKEGYCDRCVPKRVNAKRARERARGPSPPSGARV